VPQPAPSRWRSPARPPAREGIGSDPSLARERDPEALPLEARNATPIEVGGPAAPAAPRRTGRNRRSVLHKTGPNRRPVRRRRGQNRQSVLRQKPCLNPAVGPVKTGGRSSAEPVKTGGRSSAQTGHSRRPAAAPAPVENRPSPADRIRRTESGGPNPADRIRRLVGPPDSVRNYLDSVKNRPDPAPAPVKNRPNAPA
jgi:hypothetical protein